MNKSEKSTFKQLETEREVLSWMNMITFVRSMAAMYQDLLLNSEASERRKSVREREKARS